MRDLILKLFRTTTLDYIPRVCVMCSNELDFGELDRYTSELIGRVEDGTLSSGGTGVLLHLKRLPCKSCLEAMLGVSRLTSCVSST